MRNKIRRKEGNNLNLKFLIGIVLILIISFIFIVSALTEQDRNNLQSELDNLTAELSDNNYGLLVDYNADMKNGGNI